MGLYDGVSGADERGSSSHLAKVLRCPVVLVIDAAAMARSAAALVMGFKALDPEVVLAGVIANNVAGNTHYQMVRTAIEKHVGTPVLGYLKRTPSLGIPERHLGLVPKPEGAQRLEFYERIASEVEKTVDIDALLAVTEVGPLPSFRSSVFQGGKKATRGRIAVAFDEAFNFYYQDNLDLLAHQGAEVVKFSPIRDSQLPPGTGLVYIGGGFPEMFGMQLAENAQMLDSIRDHARRQKPVYAECGGLMYLSRSIDDFESRRHEMAGLVPARVRMTRSRVALGYVTARAVRDTFLCRRGEQFRGHEFHYSTLQDTQRAEFAFELRKASRSQVKSDGIIADRVLACYAHAHFASCPALAERLVAASCGE
jgi:cobyrinic acid a,c-diamide synthase